MRLFYSIYRNEFYRITRLRLNDCGRGGARFHAVSPNSVSTSSDTTPVGVGIRTFPAGWPTSGPAGLDAHKHFVKVRTFAFILWMPLIEKTIGGAVLLFYMVLRSPTLARNGSFGVPTRKPFYLNLFHR